MRKNHFCKNFQKKIFELKKIFFAHFIPHENLRIFYYWVNFEKSMVRAIHKFEVTVPVYTGESGAASVSRSNIAQTSVLLDFV